MFLCFLKNVLNSQNQNAYMHLKKDTYMEVITSVFHVAQYKLLNVFSHTFVKTGRNGFSLFKFIRQENNTFSVIAA